MQVRIGGPSGVGGVPVSSAAPTSGQALIYDSGSGLWVPGRTGSHNDFADRNLVTTGIVSVGTTPAASGNFRSAGLNGTVILTYRNTANSADIKALQVAGSDTLVLGDIVSGQVPVQFGASASGFTWTGAGVTLLQLVQGSKMIWGAVGLRKRVTAVSNANYTVLVTDHTIFVTGLTAAKTITLPASPTTGDEYDIADGDGSVTGTNTLTISGNGVNVNGAATLVLNAAFTRARVVYQGSRWVVMNQ